MTIEELQAIYSRFDDPGIYPMEFIHANGEKHIRTEWEDGWNQGLIAKAKLDSQVYQELKKEIQETGTVKEKLVEDY